MPEVLDISSDEEEGLEESLTVTDFSWIREMLQTSDEESDDSVEVVVIHENRPQMKAKSSTLTVKDVGDDDDDDDDCVILEGDPENSVASVEEEANGSDELLVIGEKGQVCVSLLYSFVCDCAHENYFKNLSCYWKQSLFCFGLCWRHAHCLCCLVMSIL